MVKRHIPEIITLDTIWDSVAYIQAIGFVQQAEKTKSAGVHKREFAKAHLLAWYQKKSMAKPHEDLLNLMIELAVCRLHKWP